MCKLHLTYHKSKIYALQEGDLASWIHLRALCRQQKIAGLRLPAGRQIHACEICSAMNGYFHVCIVGSVDKWDASVQKRKRICLTIVTNDFKKLQVLFFYVNQLIV